MIFNVSLFGLLLVVLGCFGAVLGWSWAALGRSLAVLCSLQPVLRRSWALLEQSWVVLGRYGVRILVLRRFGTPSELRYKGVGGCWQLYSTEQWDLRDGDASRLCYDCNRKQCSKCFQPKGQREFDHKTWKLQDKNPDRLCSECMNGAKQAGMWRCKNKKCKKRKPVSDFSIVIGRYGGPDSKSLKNNSRRCDECVQRFEEEQAELSKRSAAHVQKRRRSD